MAKEEERLPKACLYCGKELTKRERQTVIRNNRKYCNATCRARYFSCRTYAHLKNNPAFREKRRKEHAAWRNKNKVKWNEKCKIKMRELKNKIIQKI
jgi:hypothetical protein